MNSEYQNTLDREKLLRRLTEKIREEIREAFTEIHISDDDSLAESILSE